jgi:hypothetical protein
MDFWKCLVRPNSFRFAKARKFILFLIGTYTNILHYCLPSLRLFYLRTLKAILGKAKLMYRTLGISGTIHPASCVSRH